MFKNLGSKAEQSVPNDNELAEMFVPNCANAKAAEMKNTPARFPGV